MANTRQSRLRTPVMIIMLVTLVGLLIAPAAMAQEHPDSGIVDTGQTTLATAETEVVDEGDGFPWGRVVLGIVVVGFVLGSVYLLRSKQRRDDLTWRPAYGWAFLIFFYFVLTTTWFPSWLLSQQSVASAPRWVSDLIGSGAWFVPLVAGLFGLRWLQKTERI